MSAAPTGLAHSVQTRLVQHAKALRMDPNLVLSRFAVERFLYRLSRSPHAEKFVLKGALLMLVWLGETIRPTRDAAAPLLARHSTVTRFASRRRLAALTGLSE